MCVRACVCVCVCVCVCLETSLFIYNVYTITHLMYFHHGTDNQLRQIFKWAFELRHHHHVIDTDAFLKPAFDLHGNFPPHAKEILGPGGTGGVFDTHHCPTVELGRLKLERRRVVVHAEEFSAWLQPIRSITGTYLQLQTACVCVLACVFMGVHLYACRARIHACMYVCMYVCMCMYVCVCMH